MREEGLQSVSRGQTCTEKGQEAVVFDREFLQSFNPARDESCEVGIEGSLYACQQRSPII